MSGELVKFGKRLMWAAICLVVWPIYYAGLVLRSLIPTWLAIPLGLRSLTDEALSGIRLHEQFLSPPFLDHLRR
jgi:hypothetical protein